MGNKSSCQWGSVCMSRTSCTLLSELSKSSHRLACWLCVCQPTCPLLPPTFSPLLPTARLPPPSILLPLLLSAQGLIDQSCPGSYPLISQLDAFCVWVKWINYWANRTGSKGPRESELGPLNERLRGAEGWEGKGEKVGTEGWNRGQERWGEEEKGSTDSRLRSEKWHTNGWKLKKYRMTDKGMEGSFSPQGPEFRKLSRPLRPNWKQNIHLRSAHWWQAPQINTMSGKRSISLRPSLSLRFFTAMDIRNNCIHEAAYISHHLWQIHRWVEKDRRFTNFWAFKPQMGQIDA